jgi:uncharacterized protein (DUF2267 family)
MATGYTDFIGAVEREGELPHDVAEQAARATLETLAERISGGEARDIAEQLPEELRPVLDGDAEPQAFTAEEFFQRVQRRERVPILEAQRHVGAVFAALRETVGPDEIADLASELPRELEAMLFADEPLPELDEPGDGPMSTEEFVDRVARRTALDPARARTAIAVVLEFLAYRISGGEARDLMQRLPDELRAPLQAGIAAKGRDAAQWLPLKQLLIGVAEHEGVPRGAARLHVRAVLETLREAVGDEEMADVMSQLPKEYRSLLPRAAAR